MTKNLVIVESPAKAKTIGKFLGSDYLVKSCQGHVVDLLPNKLSIKVKENFEPEYFVLKEKTKIVKELKDLSQISETIWLATDEDREGEAISWHLAKVLELDLHNTRRIVFHEITKNAILEAIENPRTINIELVNAQQARRVLDRLVGYKISPILWKKVKPALSAGRVQSVALRLIVEREREIINFRSVNFFRITAEFSLPDNKKNLIRAELNTKFDTYEEAKAFIELCAKASFKVDQVDKKAVKKSPAPPFTTSTLQQEANRKLGFSVLQTMRLAQSLYEDGHITYMRTDSVKLSNLALHNAKEEILKLFGEEYSQTRNFSTKTKSAQEAHEAIRPTDMRKSTLGNKTQENKLYELIWKRTVASQMAEAKLEKTTVKINVSGSNHYFNAIGEVIMFDGFLKLYIESTDDETEEDQLILPPLNAGDKLNLEKESATERFTRPPFRYSEASLVKKLEELGIGRPSTYAPTISTILKREYVSKDLKPGKERPFRIISLSGKNITEDVKTENFGFEKGKLSPCNIGMIVNDFLVENFEYIIDYNFTANIENEFDEIAGGSMEWQKMIGKFYKDFDPVVEKTQKSAMVNSEERFLGNDPKTGEPLYVKYGKFGPYVQVGEKKEGKNPRYVPLKKGQLLENITFEEALELLKLPAILGAFEGLEVVANIGRFGPYIGHGKTYYSIPKKFDVYSITYAEAVDLIHEKRSEKLNKTFAVFDISGKEAQVINGRFGPYISYDKKSFKIPKTYDPKTLGIEDVKAILDAVPASVSKKKK